MAELRRMTIPDVSMKSGLEGRNNTSSNDEQILLFFGLNEVRPRRPEQSADPHYPMGATNRLNEVRPRRPEQSSATSRPCCRHACLNEVRPRRPEQSDEFIHLVLDLRVSMKSGLEGRNNAHAFLSASKGSWVVSMKSGLEGRNNHSKPTTSITSHRKVSMKSGLEGRNNGGSDDDQHGILWVSMKSGLEGRNNVAASDGVRIRILRPSQ